MSNKQTIIVKNNQASDIMIEDMGITVPAGAVINFTVDIYVILGSNDLYILVSNGNLVINDGTIDLDITTAKDFLTIETLAVDPTEIEGKLFSIQLYYRGYMSNWSWFLQWPDGNDSGDDNGWQTAIDNNDSPFIIPYNCILSHIDLFFVGAYYVNRGTTAGNLSLELALSNHNYNNWVWTHSWEVIIPGSFTGYYIYNQNLKITEPSFSVIPGYQENLIKPGLYGASFEAELPSHPGQIEGLYNPMILMTFKGVE